jgi:hypothetical protein
MCDHWIGNFEYISYFDTFDGFHPRVITPRETAPREFSSMEEIGNYLLANPETVAHFQSRGETGKVILLMFDEETEAQGLGFDLAMPSTELWTHIYSRIITDFATRPAYGVSRTCWAVPRLIPSWWRSRLRHSLARIWSCRRPTAIPAAPRFSSGARTTGTNMHPRFRRRSSRW